MGEPRYKSPGERSTLQFIQMGRSLRKSAQLPILMFRSRRTKTNTTEKASDLVELASRADCGDREDEWVRELFTAHMNSDKIAEKLLAQTRSPQDAYEYAIRREK